MFGRNKDRICSCWERPISLTSTSESLEEFLGSHWQIRRGLKLNSEFQTRWRKKVRAILALRPRNWERGKVAAAQAGLLQTMGSKAISMKRAKVSCSQSRTWPRAQKEFNIKTGKVLGKGANSPLIRLSLIHSTNQIIKHRILTTTVLLTSHSSFRRTLMIALTLSLCRSLTPSWWTPWRMWVTIVDRRHRPNQMLLSSRAKILNLSIVLGSSTSSQSTTQRRRWRRPSTQSFTGATSKGHPARSHRYTRTVLSNS